MSALDNLLKGGKDYEKIAREIASCLEKDFPTIATILGGRAASKTQEAISPGTITLFIHEGQARFSANVKSAEKTFIGDIVDIAKPFASIELALTEGKVSSKRYTEHRNGYPKDAEKLLL